MANMAACATQPQKGTPLSGGHFCTLHSVQKTLKNMLAAESLTPEELVKLANEQNKSDQTMQIIDSLTPSDDTVMDALDTPSAIPAVLKTRSASTLSAASTLASQTTTSVRKSGDGLGFYTPEFEGDGTASNTLYLVARDFRRNISLRTVMVYGLQHRCAFTGAEAVQVLMERLPVVLDASADTQPSVDSSVSVDDAIEWGRRMLAERMFIPCLLNDRSGFANDLTLYRLSRDALAMEEFSAQFLEHLLTRMRNDRTGLPIMQGKLMMRRIRPEDKLVSQASLQAWLIRELDMLPEQFSDTLRVLMKRRVLEKVSFSHVFRFLQ